MRTFLFAFVVALSFLAFAWGPLIWVGIGWLFGVVVGAVMVFALYETGLVRMWKLHLRKKRFEKRRREDRRVDQAWPFEYPDLMRRPQPPVQPTCWEMLCIPPHSDEPTIRGAHRTLAVALHPDKGGDAELMGRINAARDAALQQVGAH